MPLQGRSVPFSQAKDEFLSRSFAQVLHLLPWIVLDPIRKKYAKDEAFDESRSLRSESELLIRKICVHRSNHVRVSNSSFLPARLPPVRMR